MVGSRTTTAVVGLLVSLVVSVAIWYYTGWLLVFLLVPFVPLLFRGGKPDRGEAGKRRHRTPSRTRDRDRPQIRTCPRCGFTTENPEFDYCPRDGTRLDHSSS